MGWGAMGKKGAKDANGSAGDKNLSAGKKGSAWGWRWSFGAFVGAAAAVALAAHFAKRKGSDAQTELSDVEGMR